MSNILFGCSGKLEDSTQNGGSSGSVAEENILFEGKADTLNVEYELSDNLSNYKYIYILSACRYKSNAGLISENSYINTMVVNIDDLRNYKSVILGYMHMSGEYKTGIVYVDDTKFRLSTKYTSGGSYLDAYICKIVGIK